MNEIFEQLASTSSRLDKESILISNKDNELLRQVAFLALDPFTQFYVRKIPDYIPNVGEGISLKFALDSIQDLSKRIVTGNAAISHLKCSSIAFPSCNGSLFPGSIRTCLNHQSIKSVSYPYPSFCFALLFFVYGNAIKKSNRSCTGRCGHCASELHI